MIRHVGRAAWYSLSAVIIGSALALTVIRFWLLPEVSRFRGELEVHAGDMLGEKVHIGRISARMLGLEPQLVLHDFAIINGDDGNTALSFRRVRLGISLFSSVLERAPILASLRLEGARIGMVHQHDGTWAVRGLKPGSGPPTWLFSLESLQLRDIELEWQDLQRGSATMLLGRLTLRGRNDGASHQFSAAVAGAEGIGNSLKLVVEFKGTGMDPAGWEGRAYLQGEQLRLGAVAELFRSPLHVESGTAQVELWSAWRQGVMETLNGRLRVDKPAIVVDGTSAGQRLAFDAVGGRFGWKNGSDAWRLALDDLQWVRQGQQREADLIVEVGVDGSDRHGAVSAAISYFPLDELKPFLDLLPPGDLREALQGLAPRGVLRNARLVYGGVRSARWGVCGMFEDVGINPWLNVPGTDHWSGEICGNDQAGQMAFRSYQTTLGSPLLWAKPLSLNGVHGALQWSQEREAWRITVPTVQLEGDGVRGRAALVIDLPKGAGAPRVDLRARLSDVEAKSLREYLPLLTMSRSAATWLRDAFDGGRVARADILLVGPLADFPFRGGEGVFQAVADVENLDLDFDGEWPHLTELNGHVRFEGAGMFIDARSALIGGVPIHDVHSETSDFDRDPWLSVAGRVDTDIEQSMRFLAQTPLRHIPEWLLGVADARGETALDLKLKVPLSSDLGEVHVDGLAQLKDAQLNFPRLGLGLQRMAGTLHFDENGFKSEALRAFLLGQPVRLRVGQLREALRVEMVGKASVAVLHQAMPHPFWNYTDGSLNYRLSLETSVSTGAVPLKLALSSDLAGLAVHLPAPLGKTADVKRDLKLGLQLQEGKMSPFNLNYGGIAQAKLWLSEPAAGFSLVAGDVAVGSAVGATSRDPGLRLHVAIPELNFTEWKGYFGPGGSIATSQSPLLASLALRTDKVSWDGKDLGPLELRLDHRQGTWRGTLESRFGRGQLNLQTPEFGHPLLSLDLDVLKLPKDVKAPVNLSFDESISPDAMPSIQVRAGQVFWRDADLGALELVTERWTQGLNIKKLALRQRNYSLHMHGSWMRTEERDETRLEGTLKTGDLGESLASLGYSSEIKATPGDARFSLLWPGAPHAFSAAGVDGWVDLDLGRGSVLKLEPGFGRAMAVLNLDSLKRLLLLDFTDMFGQGLVYDGMRGRFQLGGGQARTNDFLIDAVAGVILISGRVGLVQRDVDETVTVIPHTLASVPMTGAMLGGAAVGAALSMAGKLIGQESVYIASNRYVIKGGWDDPTVSRIAGSMPLDVLDRAWRGLKNVSGFGTRGTEGSHE